MLSRLRKQRILLFVSLIIVTGAWLWIRHFENALSASNQRIEARFIDKAELFTPAFITQMNYDLHYEHNELGIDIQYLIIPSLPPGKTMEEFSVDEARTMGVGASTNGRGVLCIYDVKTQRLRIEVGPRLEGVMPDAFVSYLELENTHAYAGARELGLGLRLTEHLILFRLREAELGMAYDPRPAKLIRNRRLLAEGAGATESLAASAPGSGTINRLATPAVAAQFVAQPSVDQTWELYLAWLQLPYEYVNVPLFTEDTRTFLEHEPMSSAYRDSILMGEYGKAYRVYVSGDLAMLVFTHTPFDSPYYFRRNKDGWEMDIAGAIRNSENLVGGPYTWIWRDGHDAYSRAFRSYVIIGARYLTTGNRIVSLPRIQGGDNRTLPVYTIKLYSAAHP